MTGEAFEESFPHEQINGYLAIARLSGEEVPYNFAWAYGDGSFNMSVVNGRDHDLYAELYDGYDILVGYRHRLPRHEPRPVCDPQPLVPRRHLHHRHARR